MNLDAYLSREGAESAVDFARRAGLNPDQVRQWRYGHNDRRPSEDNCARLERASSGLVTCEELRPDLAWIRIADKAWPHPKGRPAVDITKALAA